MLIESPGRRVRIRATFAVMRIVPLLRLNEISGRRVCSNSLIMGAKILGFGCDIVLSLEKRELLNVRDFLAMRGRRTIFSCRLAEHFAEDMIEAGDNDRVSCKFIEL